MVTVPPTPRAIAFKNFVVSQYRLIFTSLLQAFCNKKKMLPTGPELPSNFFKDSFSTLQDPRRLYKGNVVYSLNELLFLVVCGCICGCNEWVEIAAFGRIKVDWFRKFFPYKRMPSHDVLGDLFSALDAKMFAECFLHWINGIAAKEDSEVYDVPHPYYN
jgi:DDE_Tnp_1-associated